MKESRTVELDRKEIEEALVDYLFKRGYQAMDIRFTFETIPNKKVKQVTGVKVIVKNKSAAQQSD